MDEPVLYEIGEDIVGPKGGFAVDRASLCRRLTDQLNRVEAQVLWYDVFQAIPDGRIRDGSLEECVLRLIDAVEERGLGLRFVEQLGLNRPDMVGHSSALPTFPGDLLLAQTLKHPKQAFRLDQMAETKYLLEKLVEECLHSPDALAQIQLRKTERRLTQRRCAAMVRTLAPIARAPGNLLWVSISSPSPRVLAVRTPIEACRRLKHLVEVGALTEIEGFPVEGLAEGSVG